jgi:hypothetical protein
MGTGKVSLWHAFGQPQEGQMNRFFFGIVSALCLTGCASSGAVPMGPDTFMISKQSSTGFHSAGSVKADIYREANEHCQSIGKQFQPVSDRGTDGQPGRSFANAEVVYRCLSAGDPGLQRPVPAQPDVVIENRR